MCTYLIIATGYYGQPNKLDVPGAGKDKVFHYFKEAHPFFNQHVLIIGGKNSSVDAAIELEKAGSHVTIVYRGDDYSKSIKPWILPQLKSLIKHGKVAHYFNAEMIDIKDDTVIFSTDEGTVEIKNDFVFAMIGYHPDYRFLKSLGIELEEYKNGLSPVHDSATMETNVEDLYIAGVIAAGNDANMIVIENGRFHGGRIIKDILKRNHTNKKKSGNFRTFYDSKAFLISSFSRLERASINLSLAFGPFRPFENMMPFSFSSYPPP